MSQKLFKVVFINQETGEEATEYVVTHNLATIEDDYADIVFIAQRQPLVIHASPPSTEEAKP